MPSCKLLCYHGSLCFSVSHLGLWHLASPARYLLKHTCSRRSNGLHDRVTSRVLGFYSISFEICLEMIVMSESPSFECVDTEMTHSQHSPDNFGCFPLLKAPCCQIWRPSRQVLLRYQTSHCHIRPSSFLKQGSREEQFYKNLQMQRETADQSASSQRNQSIWKAAFRRSIVRYTFDTVQIPAEIECKAWWLVTAFACLVVIQLVS